MSKIIGIDLGTTNSCVSVLEAGDPVVIQSAEGKRTIPSVVALKGEETLVGELAKRQAVMNPDNTVASVKRDMGKRVKRKLGDREFSPEEISAKILQKIKSDAEAYLGTTVNKAVITVPAYFDNDQRESTKKAGEIAGLEVMRIINEPTAASLAYGLNKKDDQTILVYDLGGGTFDVSILEISDGVFEVKSTSGDTRLGGDDVDEILFNYLMDQEELKPLKGDSSVEARVLDAAEKAKIELSGSATTNVSLPFIGQVDGNPVNFDHDITRSKFESLISDLVERTKKSVDRALKDAGLSAKDVDQVVLVGGSTRIPLVQQRVKEWLGKDPCKGVNPDECVAIGAAIQGSVLAGETDDIVLLDVTPLSLRIETLGGVATLMIERNSTIPCSRMEVFSTARDSQDSVEIHVLQGEREMASDNKSIGKFMLTSIPPAPRGVPQIEVTFDIDANGILNVSAKDKGTGKEQKITITGSSSLSDDEVEKMVEEAEANAEEDKKKKAQVEMKINAESKCYAAEKMVNDEDLVAKIPEETRDEITKYVETVRDLLGEDPIKEQVLNESIEALEKAMSEAGQAIYAQADAEESVSDSEDEEVVVEAEGVSVEE